MILPTFGVQVNPKLKAPLKMRAFSRDPSIQIIPTLGPKVCKYYLHWAIRIPRVWQIIWLVVVLGNP